MTKQNSIYSHPLLTSAIERYQKSRGLKSFSAAATELMILGLDYWIQNDPSDPPRSWGENSYQHRILIDEYHDWQDKVMGKNGWNEFPDLDDEQANELSFERFMLLKITPQHGGKRPNAGRKKEKP